MARTRKPQGKTLSVAYERRISRYLAAHPGASRSQARGHAGGSEYQRRTRKYLRAHPGASPAQARGHASGADLRRRARDGDLLVASMGGRNAQGQYTNVSVTLVGADGGEREYLLRGQQIRKGYLVKLVADLEAAGVIFSPAPSLDLRRMSE